MSVTSEYERVKNAIEASHLKVIAMGGTSSEPYLVDNLEGAIGTIPNGEAKPILQQLSPIVLDKETGTYTPDYNDIMNEFTAMAEGTGTVMPAIDWSEWEGSGGNDLSYGDNMRLPSLLLGVAGNGDNPISLIFGHAIQDGGSYVYLHYDNTFEIKTAGTNMIGCSLREEIDLNGVTPAEQYNRIYDAIKKGQQVHLSPDYYADFVPYSYMGYPYDTETLEEDPGMIAFVGPRWGVQVMAVVGIQKDQEPLEKLYWVEDQIVTIHDITDCDKSSNNVYIAVENDLMDFYLDAALQDGDKLYNMITEYRYANNSMTFGYHNVDAGIIEIYEAKNDDTLDHKAFSLADLTNPAGAQHIEKGYQALLDDGTVITGAGEVGFGGDAPTDIIDEAVRVADGMIPKISSNSLTFVAMSDTHEMADEDSTDDAIKERYRRANRNAGQAANLISQKIDLDFFAHLGDFAWGYTDTTTAGGVEAIRRTREYIADVANNTECFTTPGNHDTLYASRTLNGSSLDYGVVKGLMGSYRYKDFADKKVRVICLNTADNDGNTNSNERISGTQLQWFAEALDLSSKSDAADWGIIILSHHPLDWGGIKVAANCLAAYLEGSTYSVSHGRVSVSYNFAGKNAATVIAQFHGHVHGFRVDYINDLRSGSPVPTTVKRVAIPNACFGRNNEYGTNSGTENNGIEFGETTTYNKSDNNTGKNTAFCVVSIDLDEKVIYADCFGAGIDRTISYAKEDVVTYTVTNSLSNAVNSNNSATVVEGSSYSATITANSGYTIDSITVAMGGTDITSSAVAGKSISISKVTGNIVITVATTKDSTEPSDGYTNLVPTALSTDKVTVFNASTTPGYQDGARASGIHTGTDGGASYVCTGFIHISSTVTSIYVKGATWDSADSYCRFRMIAFGKIGTTDYAQEVYADNSGATPITDIFSSIETLGTDYYKFTFKYPSSWTGYAYVFSLVGTGENLIITHDEPITDSGSEAVTYTVTNTLNKVTTSNSAATVSEGASYSATLTANSGYEISTVKVTMGGSDVTASAYSDGYVSISKVTGNIVITATAMEIVVQPTYTNLVPTSMTPGGSTIFNSVGYQNGKYASGSGEGTDSNCVVTGIIPYAYYAGKRSPIYVKGATINTNSHCRILGFGQNKTASFEVAQGSDLTTYFSVETLGDQYYKVTPLETIGATGAHVEYLRFSLVGTGENLIITIGEPIQ